MPIIALLTSLSVILVDVFGPKGSVGGSLVMGFVLIVAMFAVAIFEAWSCRRNAVGWIVNILAVFLAGFAVVTLLPIVILPLMMVLQLDGTSLAGSDDPLKYIVFAVIAVVNVYGVWLTLQLINRLGARKSGAEAV